MQEQQNFNQELKKFLSWYALALSRHLVNPENPIALHPGKILDDDTFYNAQLTLSPDEIYPSELLRIIEGDYQKLLRGKSLLALLLRQLSAKHRSVKHSSQTLMENSAKSGGVKVQRIETWIAARLGKSAVDQTLNTTSL